MNGRCTISPCHLGQRACHTSMCPVNHLVACQVNQHASTCTHMAGMYTHAHTRLACTPSLSEYNVTLGMTSPSEASRMTHFVYCSDGIKALSNTDRSTMAKWSDSSMTTVNPLVWPVHRRTQRGRPTHRCSLALLQPNFHACAQLHVTGHAHAMRMCSHCARKHHRQHTRST